MHSTEYCIFLDLCSVLCTDILPCIKAQHTMKLNTLHDTELAYSHANCIVWHSRQRNSYFDMFWCFFVPRADSEHTVFINVCSCLLVSVDIKMLPFHQILINMYVFCYRDTCGGFNTRGSSHVPGVLSFWEKEQLSLCQKIKKHRPIPCVL